MDGDRVGNVEPTCTNGVVVVDVVLFSPSLPHYLAWHWRIDRPTGLGGCAGGSQKHKETCRKRERRSKKERKKDRKRK